jgi:hypothetical protein
MEYWIIGVLGQWTYKTHKGGFVKVHYPWHPLYNCEAQVLNIVNRGGDHFYTVRLPDSSRILLPAWMTDEAYCQRFVLREEPYCSVQALLELRQLLDTLDK